MKRILYTNNEGMLAIIIPAPSWSGTIEELQVKDVPKGISSRIVDISEIPTDRTFRGAWEKRNGKIETNIPKAKLIAHDMRRKARDELFKPLDIQATVPAQAQEAERQRQTIRDTDTIKQLAIDKANSVDELFIALVIKVR